MRLVALAISIPIAVIAMGFTMVLNPTCGFPASLVTAYLVLTPLVYYARPHLAFAVRPFAVAFLLMAALWAVELVLPPLLEDLLRGVIELSSRCPQWKTYFFIGAVVLAPLVEEVVFRVILYTELEKRVGPRVGYVGNSLAFAVLHGYFPLLPIYFAYGLVLTYAFRKGGYLAAVALHSINNLLAFISLPLL
ncbi:MAG: lysostaphin resistance A-like protein [Pyrobaculum sp.]